MSALATSQSARRQWAALTRIDWVLVISASLLLVIGLLCLYSVDHASPGAAYFKKQLTRVAIGLIPFAIFATVPIQTWKNLAKPLYCVNLALLVLVLLKGRSGGGAQRWLQIGPIDFQPSELAKLLVILTLAAFFISRGTSIKNLSTFVLSFLHVLIPIVLVFKQPHLGATLVLIVIWLSVCLAAGVPTRFLVASGLVVAAALTVAIRVPGVLHDYQKERVMAMLQPNAKGNAYQPLRAQIAFGVGGFGGVGYLKGEQKRAHFIPEQQNDFIFTVVGEEGGLVGCTLVLAAFGTLLFRIWLLMTRTTDPLSRMVVGGIFGMLAFHTIVNLGMNLQLLPVVGLWLPFLSYGGTAIWLCMSCIALLANISVSQRPAIF